MIDKNVPLPNSTQSKKGTWSKLAAIMEVGDSYLDQDGFESSPKGSKALNAFIQYGRPRHWKFSARKVEGGIRIWRVA